MLLLKTHVILLLNLKIIIEVMGALMKYVNSKLIVILILMMKILMMKVLKDQNLKNPEKNV